MWQPDGIDGSEIERYFLEFRITEIAKYCETDVVNTYRAWLRYELFRGRLSESEHQASERSLADFMGARARHLNRLVQERRDRRPPQCGARRAPARNC